jgi:hypothetical protein
LFIKASDDNLSWLCEFLKQVFNLFRAENGRSFAALVAAIVNASSHNLKVCGKTEEHTYTDVNHTRYLLPYLGHNTLLQVQSLKQQSKKIHRPFLSNIKTLLQEIGFSTWEHIWHRED